MRLLFVCRMFDRVAGGVERMAVNIMNAMVERGHDVTLFTWDLAEAQAFYPMSESIHWHRLDMGHAGRAAGNVLRARRAVRFRRLARSLRPNVVIGFQHGAYLFAEVSVLGLDIPVVLAERNAPDRFDHTSEGRYRRLVYQSMRPAAAITVQCANYVERYPSYLRPRMAVIPNPVYAANGFASPESEKDHPVLLSVGRLSYQKNQEALLNAFARVRAEFPGWQLRIVGEGEERPVLEKLISELGIGRAVALNGTVENVSEEYRKADLFCLPSRWEGFPNTLAEAMAHGLPAVAFRTCAGVDELIESGRNGLLAEGNGDPGALAAGLRLLMGNAAERGRLGRAARGVAGKYEPDKMYDLWDRLFQRLRRAA
jgi:GalNAc-alpha-(1->4)-GalNAc-alpha-(1->3)-diNAcBac-PP-undecaprenol alpha-1,4-N-acetyl-D-galactosaminyltransferase